MWRVRVWEQAVLVPCVIGSWRFTYTLLVMVCFVGHHHGMQERDPYVYDHGVSTPT